MSEKADGNSRQEANKKIVLELWQRVIVEADRKAVFDLVAPDYIQHNPNVAQGHAGMLALVDIIRSHPPGFVPPNHKTLSHIVAEGDLVIVIWDQQQPDPAAPGTTYTGQAFDMFRLEDGKVVEHWDDTRKSAKPWMPLPLPAGEA